MHLGAWELFRLDKFRTSTPTADEGWWRLAEKFTCTPEGGRPGRDRGGRDLTLSPLRAPAVCPPIPLEDRGFPVL